MEKKVTGKDEKQSRRAAKRRQQVIPVIPRSEDENSKRAQQPLTARHQEEAARKLLGLGVVPDASKRRLVAALGELKGKGYSLAFERVLHEAAEAVGHEIDYTACLTGGAVTVVPVPESVFSRLAGSGGVRIRPSIDRSLPKRDDDGRVVLSLLAEDPKGQTKGDKAAGEPRSEGVGKHRASLPDEGAGARLSNLVVVDKDVALLELMAKAKVAPEMEQMLRALFAPHTDKLVARAPDDVAGLPHNMDSARDDFLRASARLFPNLTKKQCEELLHEGHLRDDAARRTRAYEALSAAQPDHPVPYSERPPGMKFVEFMRREYRDKGILKRPGFTLGDLREMDLGLAQTYYKQLQRNDVPDDILIEKAKQRSNRRERSSGPSRQ